MERKKNFGTKILSLVLSAAMMITLLPTTIFGENTEITTLAGTLTITGATAQSGAPIVGDALTAAIEGGESNTGNITYEWQRDNAPITDATSETYTVVEDDFGTILSCTATSDVETGTLTATVSGAVEKVEVPPTEEETTPPTEETTPPTDEEETVDPEENPDGLPKAPLDITPRAVTTNNTVSGKVNELLRPEDATLGIRGLDNSAFKNTVGSDSVDGMDATSWFTGLPTGVTATFKKGQYRPQLIISGTPTEKLKGDLTIVIPGTVLIDIDGDPAPDTPVTGAKINITDFRVTYDVNGGEPSATNPLFFGYGNSGEEVNIYRGTSLTPPVGKSFIVWNTAADGSGTAYKPGSDTITVTEDVTLYAQWGYFRKTTAAINGVASTATSDTLTLTFIDENDDPADVEGLAAEDIKLINSLLDESLVTKGAVTWKSTGVYELAITDFEYVGGATVDITLAKAGYAFKKDAYNDFTVKLTFYRGPSAPAGTVERTVPLNLRTEDFKTEHGVVNDGGVYTNADQKWTYDTTKTTPELTLNGIYFSVPGRVSGNACALVIPDKIDIILKGENTITSGVLNAFGKTSELGSQQGTINIKGGGTLNVTSAAGAIALNNYDATFEDVTINANAMASGANGIGGFKSLTVINSEIYATGGVADDETAYTAFSGLAGSSVTADGAKMVGSLDRVKNKADLTEEVAFVADRDGMSFFMKGHTADSMTSYEYLAKTVYISNAGPNITVGEQTGALMEETAGTATFAVSANGFQTAPAVGDFTTEWCTDKGVASPAPAGITLAKTSASLITATATTEATAGDCYFKVKAVKGAENAESAVVKLTVKAKENRTLYFDGSDNKLYFATPLDGSWIKGAEVTPADGITNYTVKNVAGTNVLELDNFSFITSANTALYIPSGGGSKVIESKAGTTNTLQAKPSSNTALPSSGINTAGTLVITGTGTLKAIGDYGIYGGSRSELVLGNGSKVQTSGTANGAGIYIQNEVVMAGATYTPVDGAQTNAVIAGNSFMALASTVDIKDNGTFLAGDNFAGYSVGLSSSNNYILSSDLKIDSTGIAMYSIADATLFGKCKIDMQYGELFGILSGSKVYGSLFYGSSLNIRPQTGKEAQALAAIFCASRTTIEGDTDNMFGGTIANDAYTYKDHDGSSAERQGESVQDADGKAMKEISYDALALPAPTFTPKAGTYKDSQSVSLAVDAIVDKDYETAFESTNLFGLLQATSDYLPDAYGNGTAAELFDDTSNTVTDVEIHYTTDGSEPTATSTKYDASITVDDTMTIKAITTANINTDAKTSGVLSGLYTIGNAVISTDVASRAYNGQPMAANPTAKDIDTNAAVTLEYTYKWQQDTRVDGAADAAWTALSEAPKNIGDYKVLITGSNATHKGGVEVPFTISPKTVTVTANSYTIKSGDPLPSYGITYSGFAGTENANNAALATAAAVSCSAVDSKTSGEYPIEFTQQAVLNNTVGANYTLGNHVNGKLIVQNESSAPSIPSGGGGGSSRPKDTVDVTGSADTNVTTDNNGNASATVTKDVVTAAINAAKAEAKKKNAGVGELRVIINVNADLSKADDITVNLPMVTQNELLDNDVQNISFVIGESDLVLSMDLDTVKEINKQADADVQIVAQKADTAAFTTEAAELIGNRPVYNLKAIYKGGTVSDFNGGTVSVEIAYTLQNGEKAENVVAVYVDDNGKASVVKGSKYDEEKEVVMFTTTHFSVYGVGYEAEKAGMPFLDVTGHWAEDAIAYVYENELMSGTSKTIFSPNGTMTRGMFVTALGRLAKVDTDGYQASDFTDVKADMYYAPYVNWAASKGIVKGISDTAFAPDQSITRQEMAVIMSNYAKAMEYNVSETREAVAFADNSSIGSWAAAAVKQMQMAGVLSGKEGNKFDPTGTATRAEVAAVLHRYMELVID